MTSSSGDADAPHRASAPFFPAWERLRCWSAKPSWNRSSRLMTRQM
ncbi:MAG: hypothetical protein LUF81_07465 [Clostridiales bacterium]|nr:hypothetical protein [Clostridiales bacterium]